MKRLFRPAFTLIELLTVVAIIVTLAALLFPVFASAREKARQASCLSNVHQISLAASMYVTDWDEALPHWWQYAGEPAGFAYWTEYFQPYLKSHAVLHCPSFDWGADGPDAGELLADYALLTWGASGDGSRGNPYWRWAGPPMSLAQVRRPAETFNLTDGYTTTAVTRGLVLRHHAGLNVGFLDGHAKWLPRDEAFRVDRAPSGHWFYTYIAADQE